MRNSSLEWKEGHREELQKLNLMAEHQISEIVKQTENYIKLMVETFTDGIASRYLFRLVNRPYSAVALFLVCPTSKMHWATV